MGGLCQKSQAVLEADRRRYQALHEADVEVLADILHEQFYYTHFSGRIDSRSSYLKGIRDGKVRYGLGQTTDVVLSVYGGTVVMRGRLQLDCHAVDGQYFPLDNIFTSVWVDCGDAWQMVAWASTAVNGM